MATDLGTVICPLCKANFKTKLPPKISKGICPTCRKEITLSPDGKTSPYTPQDVKKEPTLKEPEETVLAPAVPKSNIPKPVGTKTTKRPFSRLTFTPPVKKVNPLIRVIILLLAPYIIGGIVYGISNEKFATKLLTKVGEFSIKGLNGFYAMLGNKEGVVLPLPPIEPQKPITPPPPLPDNTYEREGLEDEIRNLMKDISRVETDCSRLKRAIDKDSAGLLTPEKVKFLKEKREQLEELMNEQKEKEQVLKEKREEYRKRFGREFRE